MEDQGVAIEVREILDRIFDKRNQRIQEVMSMRDPVSNNTKIIIAAIDKTTDERSEWNGFVPDVVETASLETVVNRIRWHRVMDMAFITRHEWTEFKQTGIMVCRHCAVVEMYSNQKAQCPKHPQHNPLVVPEKHGVRNDYQ